MRRVWIVIVLAFAAATWFYGVVLSLLTRSVAGVMAPAQLMPLRWALYGLGAVTLIGGLLYFTRSLSAPRRGPQEFQQRTILALAALEATAICGFVVGVLSRSVMDYLPLGAATFVAIVLWVFPRGLTYWNEQETP